ncbi:putative transcriptional regulatory protein C3C7.04 [Fusarium austroafricanum]|uniref:Putative transcriptional regulatory protein C3C7.04 n=1 Tax=Fusarium austroafricanum TaxID=2364996 RepID=A0A8H4NUI2_9HYPO|nr:putative transcriptional regulatory protein C3C7.04 [Fusarium austroafricanum]
MKQLDDFGPSTTTGLGPQSARPRSTVSVSASQTQTPTPRRLPVNPRRHKVAPEHRKRVATACNACNVRRVRCSGEHPCRQCQSSSRDCVYPLPVEKVTITRSELQELKHKVDLYERVLRDTVPAAVSKAVADSASRQELSELLGWSTSNHDIGSAAVSLAAQTTPTVDGPAHIGRVPSEFPQLQYPSIHRQFQQQQPQPQPQPQSQSQSQLPDARLQEPGFGPPRSQSIQLSHPVATPHHRQDDEDNLASTEGRLLHDPDGYARFLGETSGATFLDYLKEFMTTVLPLAYQNLRPGSDGSAFLSSLGRYQTYDSRPLHDRDVDPTWFPAPREMDSMLSELRCFIQDGNCNWPSGGIYWWGSLSSTPTIPPSLERDSTITRLAKCRHLAFYQTAFAVVSQAMIMPPQDISIDPHLSENYFTRARMLLGNPLDITRFTPNEVAVLALMGFYLIEMNRRDAAYICVSNAMHISIMHGAHRGWLDESGKRMFWTLYVLDRYLSCLMGRPPTIMDDAIRLPLPCDAPSMPPADGLTAHVELSRISSHIVCNTYRISPSEDIVRPVRSLEAEIGMLDEWSRKLPASVQLTSNGLSDDPATCLLHMHYNQLIILTIRPVFFALVKKSFAEKLVSRQCSLSSHPQLPLLKRCIASAEHNIRLARQILLVNHPRKLLQAGLHFIFNAAIVLMLQQLVEDLCPSSRSEKARSLDLDFVIGRFEDESRVGSNYGRDCATVLRDLRVLVQRLPIPVDMSSATRSSNMTQTSTTYDPIANRTTVDMGQQWSDKLTSEGLQQPILVDQGHILYNELVSWIDMAPLKHRAVATCFIFKFPTDDAAKKPKVALFRRSGNVNIYQHKYAGVSGSVEETDADPLATAWRELEEETTLTDHSLLLFRKGKPFYVSDESIRREWTIHPFGFILKSEREGGCGEAGIQIDWEHEGYEWFDPDAFNDSDDFQGVPLILESLRRVWFNMDLGEDAGNTLNQALVALQGDHESGARQLATKALDTYIDLITKIDFSDRAQWWKNIRFAGWHLWKNGRESMGASVLNVVLSGLDIIQDTIPSSGPLDKSSIDNITRAIKKYAQDRQTASFRTGATFQTFLEQQFSGDEPLKILTLSSSSTITSAITHVLGNTLRPVEVHVLESRPLFEGVRMAQSIASTANEVMAKTCLTIHTDASVGVAAKGVDIVLIGADLIDKTAAVSNKVGSLPAVLTAKYISPRAKIVTLAEKEKVLPFAPPGQEDNDPHEVMQAWGDLSSALQPLQEGPHPQVNVKNVYFEWVSPDLIDYYITEDGVTDREVISDYAQRVGNRADQYFTNL